MSQVVFRPSYLVQASPRLKAEHPPKTDVLPVNSDDRSPPAPFGLRWVGLLMFTSRWLQAPLYVGLIIAQALYVAQFLQELRHIQWGVSEREWILVILSLIDVVMVSNLLVMVIIGGYELFVSRIKGIDEHPDRPNWLRHINSNLLKLKVAMAIIGISSIDLLRTFVSLHDVMRQPGANNFVMWQLIIHLALVGSACAIAVISRITDAHDQPPAPHSVSITARRSDRATAATVN
ncbi:TIGR00645 family protein [Nocardia sp. NPDC058058]|uniref:TIGR00645 family protein n=1 Tax=Nocardia sp. NPDC058058 TaxID=3346317 RepID=UPI0036DE8EAA